MKANDSSLKVSFIALVAGAAVIALSLSMSFGGDGCATTKGGDARRHVPEDAHAVLVVESLEKTRASVAAFLAGVEGASGLFELLQARYGVSLESAEGLVAAGLDPAGSLVIYTLAALELAKAPAPADDQANETAVKKSAPGAGGTALVVAMSVADPKAWGALLEARARLTGATVKAGPELTLAISGEAHAPAMAWANTANSVGVVVVMAGLPKLAAGAGDSGDSVEKALHAVFQRVKTPIAEDAGFFSTAAAIRAKALVAKNAVASGDSTASIWVAGSATLPLPSGKLPGLIEGAIKSLVQAPRHWAASMQISGERVSLRAQGDVPSDGSKLPASWFRTTETGTRFEAVVPRMSTALVRGQTALKSLLESVPSFLLDRFLPEKTPTIDGLPLPSPEVLLEFANGDFCVALLGLDPDEPLTLLADPRATPAEIVQLAHVGFGMGVTDPAKMRAALFTAAQRAREAGFAVARIGTEVEGFFGHSFVTRQKLAHRRGPVVPRTYSIILSEPHKALFVVTGRGEVQRFVDVAAKRAFALRDVDTSSASATPKHKGAEDAKVGKTDDEGPSDNLGRTALTGADSHLSGFAVPTRIARELADKGVPPFFLKMLSDLHFGALEFKLEERRVTLGVDVLL